MLPEWTVAGFSGHRNLANPSAVAAGIREAMERLTSRRGPVVAVSSAASGGDTLFLEEAARRNLPSLIVLPFSIHRFRQDFNVEDWQRASPLIERAAHVHEISGEVTDEAAYMEAGIETVDLADVMIVVWDQKPAAGFGGTADVVDYLKSVGKPFLIIDPLTGKTVEERLDGLADTSPAGGSQENLRAMVEQHFLELDESAEFVAPTTRGLVLWIIRFQFLASAIGLGLLAFQKYEIRRYIHATCASLEMILLVAAFFMIWRFRKIHHQWIKSRIEAEICRSILATWDMRRQVDHFPKLSVPGFEPLCRSLRLMRILDKSPSLTLDQTRARYLKERVAVQIEYFENKGAKARKIHRTLRRRMLAATGVAALCSLLCLLRSEVPGLTDENFFLTLKLLSILLPLLSVAIFIRIGTQDYFRREVRYEEILSMLRGVERQLTQIKTWNGLARMAGETEEKLLQEVIEWHSFRQFAGEPAV